MVSSVSGLKNHEAAASSSRSGWRRLVLVGAGLVVTATVANVLIAMTVRNGLGVPATFQALSAPAVASGTIVGMIGATLVFAWVARAQAHPRPTFLLIPPLGPILSCLPHLPIP